MAIILSNPLGPHSLPWPLAKNLRFDDKKLEKVKAGVQVIEVDISTPLFATSSAVSRLYYKLVIDTDGNAVLFDGVSPNWYFFNNFTQKN